MAQHLEVDATLLFGSKQIQTIIHLQTYNIPIITITINVLKKNQSKDSLVIQTTQMVLESKSGKYGQYNSNEKINNLMINKIKYIKFKIIK